MLAKSLLNIPCLSFLTSLTKSLLKMLEHLPGKNRQAVTSLQRWNSYHQNTKNTTTYSKYLKNVFHCQNILKTITKSFWKHRGNWQPVRFITKTKKKRKLFRFIIFNFFSNEVISDIRNQK